MSLRALHLNVLSILLLFTFSSASGQNTLKESLNASLKNYEMNTVETEELYAVLSDQSKFHSISITLGEQEYQLELWDSGIRPKKNIVRLASGKKYVGTEPIPLKGHIKGDLGSDVRLTINEGFLYGYIKQQEKLINVQPAYYFHKNADPSLIVSYDNKDYIDTDEPKTCGVTHDAVDLDIKGHKTSSQKRVGECYDVEVGLAADWLMFDDFGSVNSVDNHITGVLNDVQGNYENGLLDVFEYDLDDVWISDCITCDPWTSSNSASQLLNAFSSWAPGNLDGDIASLWSARNFSGSTVGLAWVGQVCRSLPYNVLENFTNNSNSLRVLQAHEFGHNWDAGHDSGGGFIMSPSVNNTNDWSTDSQDDIEDYASRFGGCLGGCSGGNPPTADFTFEIEEECAEGEVEFMDLSSGANEWEWSFEGGTPDYSYEQNPTIEYLEPGLYGVTLEVFNAAGDDKIVMDNLVEILGPPEADFYSDNNRLVVDFFENAGGGVTSDYFWDFGDGNNSFDYNPTHEYDQPGTYTVLMEVENDCGEDDVELVIEVYDKPEADFSADKLVACPGEDIQFLDQSYGRIVDWEWTFIGGTPDESNDQNPVVAYDSPGSYEVELFVKNPEGRDSKTKTAYITIKDNPTSNFTYTVNQATVTFTENSTAADSIHWDFGDGSTNATLDTMPVHTYASSGSYNVVLSSFNDCSVDRDTQVVSITVFIDTDGDGYPSNTDCDDNNANVNPGQSEIPYNGIDDDCNTSTLDDDLDQDGYPNAQDCDDNNSSINPGVTEVVYNGIDDDCNSATLDDDLDQDGYPRSSDCDDNNAGMNPGLSETPYNGVDDDCDPSTLDDDLDQDGYPNAQDCDDNNASVNPGNSEIVYNGIDDDCNSATLDDDLDQDGFPNAQDCDDNNSSISPNAPEICDNIDNNCDGQTDEGLAIVTYYQDADGDGYGNSDISLSDCNQPSGYVTLQDDCDDTNPAIYPGATEILDNGIDENCDGVDASEFIDNDGDGVTSDIDCNDSDPTIFPGAPEICDDKDNDCNSIVDDGLPAINVYVDMDNDGYGDPSSSSSDCQVRDGFSENNLDCDDTDPNVNPSNNETPYNGIDDDCDSATLDDDLDQDGFLMADDCDDMNADINPSNSEIPYNGQDDDCDTATLDDDLDQDGFLLADDCDDENAAIYPGAEEIPNNGIDEDCDGMDLVSAVHELSDTRINIYPNPATTFIRIDINAPLNFKATVYDLRGRKLFTHTNSSEIMLNDLPQGTYLLEVMDIDTGKRIVEKIAKD